MESTVSPQGAHHQAWVRHSLFSNLQTYLILFVGFSKDELHEPNNCESCSLKSIFE